MPIKQVQDLRIYSLAMELLPGVYELRIRDRDLRSQLTRAARSISANIHEGYARKDSTQEFKRFLRIALGSSDEVQTHLEQTRILFNLDTDNLQDQYKQLSKQIQKTIQIWN
jgi:four helix bundle protein